MPFSETVEKTAKKYDTDINKGLSPKEAKRRLSQYGKNKLRESKKKGIALLFFEQFNDFLIIILIAAACISFFTSIIDKDGDIAEPIIILSIVVFNAVLGVIQERKAEKSIEALKKMSAPSACVIRDGEEMEIPADEICRGDILVLRTGDVVAADIRLFEARDLECDESALTGESVPVNKKTDVVEDEYASLADRHNMAYSGTFVTGGKGKGIVVATGMETEVGRIADMLSQEEENQTPLQMKLEQVGKYLGVCALLICALVFVIGVFHHLEPFDMFVTSISLAVAAIPEGLPAIVTIMLSIGVQKMAKSGAIVRNLPAVETLGSADVICTDKTGTLTENKMKVKEIYGDKIKALKYAGICCSENTKNPTELAILKECEAENISYDANKKGEEPFSSKTKEMRVLTSEYLVIKGAPEIVLSHCTHYLKNGNSEALSPDKRKEILDANNGFASEALRVIAVAYKNSAKNIKESGLVFCGLIGISDPPRKEVPEAVRLCKSGGIRPVMITGDHKVTAFAIAKEVGIASSKDECIVAKALDKMTDEEMTEAVQKYSVFARATPEHKVRIVKALKALGNTVAMTGDGVNDAPALKCADIGCSLGIAGTDVAKASSDLVLTDDNFATIVKAARLGREIHENIRKSVKFLLSSNIGEIATVFISIAFGLPVALLPMQLLWINLVTDSLPAVALGIDPVDKDLLLEKGKSDKLFDLSSTVSIILEGMLIGALSLFAFCTGLYVYQSIDLARTMSFCVLSFSQLIHAFNMRSEESVLGRKFFKNKLLVFSFVLGISLQFIVVSFMSDLFGTVPMTCREWKFVFLLSVMPLVVVELQKALNKIFKNHKQ